MSNPFATTLHFSFPRRNAVLAAAVLIATLGCGSNDDDTPAVPTPVAPVPAPIVPVLFTPNTGTINKSSDASTAVPLGTAWMLVADDESNTLRVYPRAGGAAVLEWDYKLEGPKLTKELDVEASVKLGNRVYFIGSHSNKKDGANVPAERGHLFAVDVAGEGAATTFAYVGKFSDLEAQLVNWDAGNFHALGANYYGFAVSAGAGVVPERSDGFSIEGMSTSPDDKAMWLAFRAPLVSTSARNKALIVPVNNYAELVAGTATTAVFGIRIELDLGGRGIRSLEKSSNGKYLILAGPAAGSSSAVDRNFALYTWSGLATEAPVELDNNLEILRAANGGSFESIVDVTGPVAEGSTVHLLTDNGDTVWPGKTAVSKDLPVAEHQFQGFSFKLGAARADTAGPVLKTATPADDRAGVPVDSKIVLEFNEAIKWGAGRVTLRKSDGTAVETFDLASPATRAVLNYNVLTLVPSARLQNNTAYHLTVDATALTDLKGNPYAGFNNATTLNFVAADVATPLAVGDVLFMAANADVPDAIAFVILKNINGGTQIVFSDRDYKETLATANGGNGFFNITNEGVFVWTADRNLPAGTIVTIQTDTSPQSPIADIGVTMGAPAGIGKEEVMYALTGTVIDGLGQGVAGKITAPGTFLASITVGGLGTPGTRDIPASLTAAGTAMDFSVSPANQVNAIYSGSFERADTAAFAVRVKNKANWTVRNTVDVEDGFGLTNGSLFFGK